MSKNKKTTKGSAAANQSEQRSSIWAARQIGYENYFFLVICVFAQLLTVLITWPLWEIRQSPVNLPWINAMPQIPYGILVIASLVGVLISPRRYGLAIHCAVLAAAVLSDQTRCQPQVLWVAVLSVACVFDRAKQFCVWALVALWLWAGIHKAISSEWYQGNAYQLMQQAGVTEPLRWCYWFALLVTISEIAHGVLAIFRPRAAAITCALLHLGIAGFMMFIQYNFSVVPWNICTAIVGTWLMFKAVTVEGVPWKHVLAIPAVTSIPALSQASGSRWLGWCAIALLLVLPAGFYTGHVRHCFAHVLYSGGLPLASISKADGTVDQLLGWDVIRVPFPHEPSAFRDYFRLTAAPGEKLHIHEVRPWLRSHYYQLDASQQLQEISRSEFFAAESSVGGIGCDDRTATFELIERGAKMKRRTADAMIFAISFTPEDFSAAQLDLVNDLPNIEEIQLKGCDVRDDDLKRIVTLNRLRGIGLNQTPITHAGLTHLSGMTRLTLIEYNGQVYDSIAEIIELEEE
jgi:hypothetical protein